MANYVNNRTNLIERKISNPGLMHDVHFHNKHEMYFLEKGSVRYFVGNEIFLLNEGNMIFIPKNVFHKTDSSESETRIERLLFSFDDDLIIPELRKYIAEMDRNRLITFEPSSLTHIKDIFYRMEAEAKKNDADTQKLQHLYFNELLILISRCRIKNTKNILNETYKIIEDAAKYISENACNNINLTNLAEKFAMSPGHFSKQFKKITGVGVNEYINICRITMAEKLLSETDMPITAIALSCGFNDSNYFAAVFKKLKGITPKKYSIINRNGI